jgi:hypothetical protein
MMEPTIKTDADLEAALRQITFVNSVLDFKWKFEYLSVTVAGDPGKNFLKNGWLLWVSFERPDTITGTVGRGRGRDEIIWQGTSLSGAVKTAWVLVELMIRHELMEAFRWDDARIFNPHNSVIDLAALQREHNKRVA